MFIKFLRLVRIFLYKIDLFSSAKLLRVKTQTGYSTLTGGFLSLAIITIFGTLLIQDSIRVLTKREINSIDSTYYEQDPRYVSFNLNNQKNPFMFAVGIENINLTKGNRYFDVSLTSVLNSYGKKGLQVFHKLQPCREDQWPYLSKQGANSFKSLGLDGFLCPPNDLSIELQGKFTSQTFKYIRLKVGRCRNTSDPRPCADPLTLSQTGTFTLSFYFMNTYINSAEIQPVDYYLQDRNFFGFTMSSSADCNLYMAEHAIVTDESLFPWTNRDDNDNILYISQLAEYKPNQVSSSFISVYLRKAPYYKMSERSYPKLMDLFSNIGGLFGFVVTFFMLINEYTQVSYEIQMGEQLFFYDSTQPLQSKTFNFLYFIALFIYEILVKINIEIPWKRMKQYYECKQQIKEQLDLSLFMNKITFLEKCMNVLFEEHQFRAIYLQQKPDVKYAQTLRKNHGLNKIIHNQAKYFNKKTQKQVKKEKKRFLQNLIQAPKSDNMHIDKMDHQQHQVQSRAFSINSASANRIPYDLRELMTNFIVKFPLEHKIQSSDNENQSDKLDVQFQEATQQNEYGLKFINTALNDIIIIQQQSKKGNIISTRIYQQLNNDITKQQIIILKCLETVIAKKKSEEIGEDKCNLVNQILKINAGKNQSENQEKGGLEIILESNNRIQTNHHL